MSWEASTWALSETVGNATRKLVLLGYANHASANGEDAWPSVKTVADYAECEPRSVQRHVAWLVENGYMREGAQEVPRAKYRKMGWDLRYVPVNYDLAMDEDARLRWSAEHAEGASNDLRRKAAAAGAKGGSPTHKKNLSASHVDDVVSSPAKEGCQDVTPPSGLMRGDSADHQGVTNDLPRGDTGVTQTVLEPSQELPNTQNLPVTADAETAPADLFDEFWSIYPRKVGKVDARRVWDRAVRKTDPQAIVDGARRYATDPNLPTGDRARFIAHPSTWLHAGRWDDEPLPPDGGEHTGAARRRGFRDARPEPGQPLPDDLDIDEVFGPPKDPAA